MAHKARVAGTDYAVAGGKTLIDGTAYSIIVTREVENTLIVTGSLSGSKAKTFTITDNAFDWSKYNLRALFIKGGGPQNELADELSYVDGAVWHTSIQFSSTACGGSGPSNKYSMSVGTKTNGQLTVNYNSIYGTLRVANPVYFVLLEAKT